LVITALTMPVPVFLLALLGAGEPARLALGRLPGLRRLLPGAVERLRADPLARLASFTALQAAVQLGAVSLPGVPKYGGEKLFLPLLPFAAVLAALGFRLLATELAALSCRRGVPVALPTLLLAPGLVGAVVYRDTPLSYYNELAGGLRGATAAGFERQYYDLAYPEIARALRELLPNGGGVAVLPNPKEYSPHLARWQRRGELPRAIRPAPPERADLLVLTHERRWVEYPDLLATYRTRPLLYRFTRAGVPLFSIYDLRADARPR